MFKIKNKKYSIMNSRLAFQEGMTGALQRKAISNEKMLSDLIRILLEAEILEEVPEEKSKETILNIFDHTFLRAKKKK